jgi:hypothetical protein
MGVKNGFALYFFSTIRLATSATDTRNIIAEIGLPPKNKKGN